MLPTCLPPLAQLPRPRRKLWEAFASMQVASLVDRGHYLGCLYAQLPALLAAQPVRRIYQLPYLAHANRCPFRTGFAARKMACLGLLDKLTYGEDEFGLVVCGELVSVYLLRFAGPGYGAVGLLPAQGSGYALPVPNRLFLGRLLVAATRILW